MDICYARDRRRRPNATSSLQYCDTEHPCPVESTTQARPTAATMILRACRYGLDGCGMSSTLPLSLCRAAHNPPRDSNRLANVQRRSISQWQAGACARADTLTRPAQLLRSASHPSMPSTSCTPIRHASSSSSSSKGKRIQPDKRISTCMASCSWPPRRWPFSEQEP